MLHETLVVCWAHGSPASYKDSSTYDFSGMEIFYAVFSERCVSVEMSISDGGATSWEWNHSYANSCCDSLTFTPFIDSEICCFHQGYIHSATACFCFRADSVQFWNTVKKSSCDLTNSFFTQRLLQSLITSLDIRCCTNIQISHMHTALLLYYTYYIVSEYVNNYKQQALQETVQSIDTRDFLLTPQLISVSW